MAILGTGVPGGRTRGKINVGSASVKIRVDVTVMITTTTPVFVSLPFDGKRSLMPRGIRESGNPVFSGIGGGSGGGVFWLFI